MVSRDAHLKIVVDAQDKTQGTFRSLNGHLSNSGGFFSSFAGKAALATAALGVLGAAAAAASSIIKTGFNVAAQLETAKIGMTTLLGSTEKAADTIARLKKEAARTPFELPGLTQATQLLSSVTKDGNKSIDILLDIGEALAAMGKGQAELDRIIVNLQQVGAIGYASMVDIKQFAYAGIPIFEMLKEETGLAGDALADFISTGGVTFEKLIKMFDEANDEGGRFFNAFVNQAGSFNQVLSNMKDSFGIFASDFVTKTGLMDAAVVVMTKIASTLTAWTAGLGGVKESMAAMAETLDRHTGLVTLVKDVWANLVMVFNQELRPALAELWVALQPYKPFLDALVQVLGTGLVIAIGALIIILGTLAVGLTLLFTSLAKIGTYIANEFNKVWDSFTDKLVHVIALVEKFINLMRKAMDMAGIKGISTLGGSLGKSVSKLFNVNDAIIAPGGRIITTHPDDYLIATKNPRSLLGGSGGLTINIFGGTYLSEDVAEDLGDLILGRLKLSAAL